MSTLVTVGLLSDTHLPYRLKRLPQAALDALAGVDLILHAGDVDDPAALEPLWNVAPVYAVRGNLHLQDLSSGGASLPATVELELGGKQVLLVHGHRPGPPGFLFKGMRVLTHWLGWRDNGDLNQIIARRLARLYPAADVVVFGHSHRAHVEWIGHTLLVNPGAVCPTRGERPTVARMYLGVGRPKVEIVSLLTGHRSLSNISTTSHSAPSGD